MDDIYYKVCLVYSKWGIHIVGHVKISFIYTKLKKTQPTKKNLHYSFITLANLHGNKNAQISLKKYLRQ